jgi:hypothetical protein
MRLPNAARTRVPVRVGRQWRPTTTLLLATKAGEDRTREWGEGPQTKGEKRVRMRMRGERDTETSE